MSFSGPITIGEGKLFRLDSYGNGAAYTLWDLTTGASVYLQGDDATTFRDELDKVETVMPLGSQDEVLGWLWDQCDYGSAATVRVAVAVSDVADEPVAMVPDRVGVPASPLMQSTPTKKSPAVKEIVCAAAGGS